MRGRVGFPALWIQYRRRHLSFRFIWFVVAIGLVARAGDDFDPRNAIRLPNGSVMPWLGFCYGSWIPRVTVDWAFHWNWLFLYGSIRRPTACLED